MTNRESNAFLLIFIVLCSMSGTLIGIALTLLQLVDALNKIGGAK